MKYSIILATLLSVSAFATEVTTIPASSTDQAPMRLQEVPTQTENTTPSNITVVCPQTTQAQQNVQPVAQPQREDVLEQDSSIRISVIGQGVAPVNTFSPAQAYALAKRAATADAYRLIAEKVKGVKVDGEDYIQNMMVKRSSVRTSVRAMVRNANIVETTFKDGLCEVEMEITLSYADFAH